MLPIDELVEKTGNRFLLATLVAKRSKQLNQGAKSLVELDGPHKPLFISLQEVMEQKLQYKSVGQ